MEDLENDGENNAKLYGSIGRQNKTKTMANIGKQELTN